MYWSLVAVQILIIAIIANDSFPIDLEEIQQDDIYLVDKERKGRFIAVNQTTFQPNLIELIREKKSSKHDAEELDDVMINDSATMEESKPTEEDSNLSNNKNQKIVRTVAAPNNSTGAESRFEQQTFGEASFVEDHLNTNCQHFVPDLMLQTVTDENCCNFDKTLNAFRTIYFPCIDEFIIPEENLFC